jgi:hypothetical protein
VYFEPPGICPEYRGHHGDCAIEAGRSALAGLPAGSPGFMQAAPVAGRREAGGGRYASYLRMQPNWQCN